LFELGIVAGKLMRKRQDDQEKAEQAAS